MLVNTTVAFRNLGRLVDVKSSVIEWGQNRRCRNLWDEEDEKSADKME